jgi:hypothetical protein
MLNCWCITWPAWFKRLKIFLLEFKIKCTHFKLIFWPRKRKYHTLPMLVTFVYNITPIIRKLVIRTQVIQTQFYYVKLDYTHAVPEFGAPVFRTHYPSHIGQKTWNKLHNLTGSDFVTKMTRRSADYSDYPNLRMLFSHPRSFILLAFILSFS